MERFDLNTWLEDKSRKIVTRDGKQARIICYDVKKGKQDDYNVPIIALVDRGEEFGEMSYYYSEDGRFLRNPDHTHNFDLFFADEEEELTELQKTIEEDCDYYAKLYNEGYTREELREWIKCWCHCIIDLARKEIEKENPYRGNQNQEWCEKDKNMLLDIINDAEQGALLDDEQINWLKSITDRMQPQLKQEWSEEDEKLYTSALWHIKNSCGNGGKDSGEYEVYNWLKSIKDRVQPKPKQEWGEEDEKELKVIISELKKYVMLNQYGTPLSVCDISWLEELPSKFTIQPQPKQEWSEEDENMCSQVINEIEAIKSNSSTIFEKNIAQDKIDWLNSIKDRVQPKQELSEEDEKKINGLIKGLEDRMGFGWASQPFTREEYIELLKSLKYRIQQQPHWKPSEEQMEALFEAKLASIKNREYFLGLLYEDLKKL